MTSRYTRDEFVGMTGGDEDGMPRVSSGKSSSPRRPPGLIKSLILHIEEYYSLHKAVVVSWLFLLSVLALVLLGLVVWALVLGNETKTVGEAAITQIKTQLTSLAAQVSAVASGQDVETPLTIQELSGLLCSTGSGTMGYKNTTDWVLDECDSIYIVATIFKTPTVVKNAVPYELCAYVGPTIAGLDQYRVAVYDDDGFGYPTDLIGASDVATVTPDSINCVTLNGVTLGDSHAYWLAFMSNANDCGSLNTLRYKMSPSLRSGFTDAYVWPDFPEVLGSDSFSYFSAVYGMYLSYNATCISSLI